MNSKSTRPCLAAILSFVIMSTGCGGSISSVADGAREDADGDGDRLDAGGDLGADTGIDGGDQNGDWMSDGGDPGQPPEQDWEEDSFPFRKIVTLQPHPDRDRTNLPVIAVIEHPGTFVLREMQVYEVSGGMNPVPVAASSWSEPGGHLTQVGFGAPGLTPAGETREFAVYYQTADSPEPWLWTDSGWATRQQLPGGVIGVSGGCCGIVREVDQGTGSLLSGRRGGGQTAFKLLSSGWKVAEGFSNSYQLESNTSIYPPRGVESEPYADLYYDADGFQAAFAASWGLDTPVPHGLALTQRLFHTWPFAQYLLSAESSVSPLNFSSNDWNGRHVYLTDSYDRMISDTRGDESISSKWDTGMRWLVVYDSATDKGFGWFSSHKGVIRADPDSGPVNVFDSYGYSSGSSLSFSALWMAAEDKDEIVELFDAMKPGVLVSDYESRDLNIIEPVDGSFYFPEDTLRVAVSTPGNPLPVTATLTLPDDSRQPMEMNRVGNSWVWEASAPLVFNVSHPEGSWTVEVQSGGATRRATVQFRHPVHPRLLFSASDLPQIHSRKDGAHAAIWSAMLAEASGYGEPMDDPGPGKDIRGYANRLINLALIQLVDPTQEYDALLWNYFFKMLRYPNWTSDERPFNNYDLTVGHFLTALALTYDWHYDRFTPAERRELRARLADMADTWLTTGWLRHYPDIDWTRYGSVSNNHYWINNEGVAAVAFVLQDELPETRRAAWEERTEANLAVILSVLEDDGTSNEGVAYHSYGQINLFPWLDMRDRANGGQTAHAIPWFANSILWDLYSIAPGGEDNYGGPANFGDCPPYHYNPPHTIQAWLAARLDNGYAQWMAEDLQWPRQTVFSYLWYDPSVAVRVPDGLPPWRLFDNRGIFVWRSSWNNDANYFSLKSGSYFGGHEQPDAGHFILHRAGVPYITDYGYSYWKMTDEHNLILADGSGQYGQDNQWMAAVDPAHWAGLPFALGDAAYFDMLADPTPMYQSSDLQSWQREVVGLQPGIFLVRDVMAAGAQVEFSWLLHGYKTDPPSSENHSYTYIERRLENPWEDQGNGNWLIRPQASAPALQLQDCSADSWSAVIEPSFYVPEQKLDVGGYNEDLESFQLGYRLRRTRSDTAASSLVAAWFGDAISVAALATSEAEGVRLYDSAGDVAIVIWPFSGSAPAMSGLAVNGAMGGVRQDEPAYFGRDLTQLMQDGQLLVRAQTPVSIFARCEHTADVDNPHFASVQASSEVVLDLYCPSEPTQLTMDGIAIPFNWNGDLLSVTLPTGNHRLEMF